MENKVKEDLLRELNPVGTNIVYKIQDSEGNNLASITAAEAEVGYKLINLNTQIIRIYAKLLSSDGLNTPILKDWTVKAIIIDIVNPVENEIFGVIVPNFTVEIRDPNLNTTWYTLEGAPKKYIFTVNGTINQTAWMTLSDGIVSIRFYANNSFGEINFKQVNVIKDTLAHVIFHFDSHDFDPPDFDSPIIFDFLLIGIFILTILGFALISIESRNNLSSPRT